MKKKYELEFTINSSPKVLYNRLSTPGGLSEWFADDVNIKGKTYTFIWNGTEETAQLVQKKENIFIRFQWTNEEYSDTFFEFRITSDELTGDVSLLIIDYADDDEKDDAVDLWNTQVAELKHVLGL
ncbi:MAG: SRPBCC domain-containing protein [Bacteroidales bacterium]|nr:SRPBCC domain-containing protein [Bacteroidales bacterium]